jgi:DNA-binding NarL/FixJ family response regulator
MALSVVLLQRDPAIIQSLTAGLRSHFQSVHLAGSHEELWEKVAQNRAEVVVLDVEASRFTEVESLHRDFPSLLIVCTHRIPDEEMWMAALEAGAVDVCPADDVEAVMHSVLRSVTMAQNTAA